MRRRTLYSAPLGGYAAGCLAGAERLAESGPGWQAMRLSRNRNWGHPQMIAFIEKLSRAAQAAGWPGLYVGDISHPRGGPMVSSHRSHQIGLDADIWLRPPGSLEAERSGTGESQFSLSSRGKPAAGERRLDRRAFPGYRRRGAGRCRRPHLRERSDQTPSVRERGKRRTPNGCARCGHGGAMTPIFMSACIARKQAHASTRNRRPRAMAAMRNWNGGSRTRRCIRHRELPEDEPPELMLADLPAACQAVLGRRVKLSVKD